jgi:uncharacterized heparinase superfamily protein
MTRLSLSERARLIGLLADRSRRTAAANVLASPLLRWRYGPPAADQLVILPQDLRTADPSFWSEISVGHFGLAGTVAFLRDASPFSLTPPSRAWARELNGFGWLRHLDAARNAHAQATAVSFVLDWIERQRGMSGVAWEPAVVGRRLISWIAHANLLLDGEAAQSYDAIAQSLGEQIVRLSSSWRHAPAGYERLLSLTALVLADLCVADHDRQLETFEHLFAAEIDRQILADGGHISRNPSVLVELLLDFLPLGQCFVSRGRPIPAALSAATHRMLPMLRFLRLGDGALARFNGAGAPQPDALATVLAYEGRGITWPQIAPDSRYARLASGETIVIVDAGRPPPLEYAGQAHAGCLSFEMSVGVRALFVNGGSPGPTDEDWRPASRATASHSTLCLNDRSSSRLVRSRALEDIVGAPPIRFPDGVTAHAGIDDAGNQTLTAAHDGYVAATKLVHTRTLMLAADGRRLDGIDRLGPPRGVLRLSRDAPYAIHFHLHPDVACERSAEAVVLEFGAHRWLFEAPGVRVEIDDSVYFSDFSGPRRTKQIVLRGASFGATEVTWTVRDALDAPVLMANTPMTVPASAEPEVREHADAAVSDDEAVFASLPPFVPLAAAIAAARTADAISRGAAAPPATTPPPLPTVVPPPGLPEATGEPDFATALAQAMEDALLEDLPSLEPEATADAVDLEAGGGGRPDDDDPAGVVEPSSDAAMGDDADADAPQAEAGEGAATNEGLAAGDTMPAEHGEPTAAGADDVATTDPASTPLPDDPDETR